MIIQLLKMASVCHLWQEGMFRPCLKPSNLPLILTAAWSLLLYAIPYTSKLLHKDNGSYWEFSSVNWIPANMPTNNEQKWFCTISMPWCVHSKKREKESKANGLFSESCAVSIRKLSYWQCSLSYALLCNFALHIQDLTEVSDNTVCQIMHKKMHQFLCIHAKFYFHIFPTAHKFPVLTLAELL